MKRLLQVFSILLFLMTAPLLIDQLSAQVPDPGGDPGGTPGNEVGAPIGGGFGILLVLGAAYGAFKVYGAAPKKKE